MASKTSSVTLTEAGGWTALTTNELTCLVQLKSGFSVEVAIAAAVGDLADVAGHPLRALPAGSITFAEIATGDKVCARTLDGNAVLLVTKY